MKAAVALIVGVLALIPSVAAAEPQACTFTLSRTNIVAGPEGPIFARIDVTASAQTCQWSSSTTAPWITVDPSLRTGSATAPITLMENTSGSSRTATVTVAGQTVDVTQQTTPCVTSLVPNALTFPYPGFGDPADQRKSVTVNAPSDCHWGHSPWPIVVTPNPTFGGVGTQTVTNVGIITFFPGQGPTITVGIGSQPLTLTRLDPPCVFTLSQPTAVSVNGGSGMVNVTGTGPDCTFAATVSAGAGASITQSAAAAPATITYTFTQNPGNFSRSAEIKVPNVTVLVSQNGAPARTDVTSVAFGGIASAGALSPVSAPEDVRLTLDEQPNAAWNVAVSEPWIVVTPASGSGPATLRVSVDSAMVASMGLAPRANPYNATIAITAAFAPATAVRVLGASLQIKAAGLSGSPGGVFETPLNNSTGVSGAIPVTGWAVDDIGIARIQIYRDPVAGEGAAEIYIGDATRVRGARPDIAAWYSNPEVRLAGWGYMLLSNVLPGGGNGTFTFSAYVDDLDGHRVLLGRRTATFDNAVAVRPFGTIDEPAQGQTISGTIVNRGWVLTPQPKAIPANGSSLNLLIDGVVQPQIASYSHVRPDVQAYFPGLINSGGPEARFSIDTTTLSDGVHTISWSAVDDAGVVEGIGSRYFTVQNGAQSQVTEGIESARSAAAVTRLPQLSTDIWSREGVDEAAMATRVGTDAIGRRSLLVSQGQRLELFLLPIRVATCGTYTGHMLDGEVAAPLPPGASLDSDRGIFRWQPAPQFKGTFNFVFVERGCDGRERRMPVRVVIGGEK